MCGCSIPDQADFASPADKELSTAYRETKLKESNSADVLTFIAKPEQGAISQSKSVIAKQGINKKGYKLWFNMITFDENATTAIRKSFFVVDEKTESLLIWPRHRLVFDTEMVLDPKVLNEPYANENARRVAILRQVAENTRQDVASVSVDNKTIGICGMLVNQTMGTVLYRLEQSPALASQLSDPNNGFKFNHMTLGDGKIVMDVNDDVVGVKVRLDNYVWSGEDPLALEE